jgi:hypothetical protein
MVEGRKTTSNPRPQKRDRMNSQHSPVPRVPRATRPCLPSRSTLNPNFSFPILPQNSPFQETFCHLTPPTACPELLRLFATSHLPSPILPKLIHNRRSKCIKMQRPATLFQIYSLHPPPSSPSSILHHPSRTPSRPLRPFVASCLPLRPPSKLPETSRRFPIPNLHPSSSSCFVIHP